MNTSTTKLPKTPSALIRLALADLRACEADDRYEVHMTYSHVPVEGVCHVSLAGAVMAQTLGLPKDLAIDDTDIAGYICCVEDGLRALVFFRRGEGLDWIHVEYGCRVEDGLRALDYFRRGEIEEGLDMLGYDVDKLSEEWEQYAYEAEYDKSDPDEFHDQMNSLADYLASCGL